MGSYAEKRTPERIKAAAGDPSAKIALIEKRYRKHLESLETGITQTQAQGLPLVPLQATYNALLEEMNTKIMEVLTNE